MKKLFVGLVAIALVAGVSCIGCASSQEEERPSPANEKESAAAWPLSNPQHAANNMKCVTCHDEEDPTQGVDAVATEKCLSCHVSYEKVADRTASVGEETNPHDNFHYDMQLDCTTCHKSHSDSMNLCSGCHDVNLWMDDIP